MRVSSFEIPMVHETALSKSMVFSDIDIQSRMSVARPNELQFEYTRLMMGAWLFQPQPQRILMVGLGGGSLAKFCYQHFPQMHITVLEINPHVIALRQQFLIPDDDARFEVVQVDAAHFMGQTPQTFDWVLVDGFDQHGLPEPLCSPQFYADCRRVLTPSGVAVFNLHRFHAYRDVYVDRIASAFAQALWVVNAPGTTNCVVFAVQEGSPENKWTFTPQRPTQMIEEGWSQISASVARVYLATQDKAKV
jgi:spermidine synthase